MRFGNMENGRERKSCFGKTLISARWEELEYYKKQSELDEYDKEEVELLNEEINELFNDYKELYTNCADQTLEEGMKRVTEWFKEREELMNGNKSPTAQEKKR